MLVIHASTDWWWFRALTYIKRPSNQCAIISESARRVFWSSSQARLKNQISERNCRIFQSWTKRRFQWNWTELKRITSIHFTDPNQTNRQIFEVAPSILLYGADVVCRLAHLLMCVCLWYVSDWGLQVGSLPQPWIQITGYSVIRQHRSLEDSFNLIASGSPTLPPAPAPTSFTPISQFTEFASERNWHFCFICNLDLFFFFFHTARNQTDR